MKYLPHLAYDSVIFGFSGDRLKILIMEYHRTGWFALPGGFVGREETLDAAVRRGLEERTGLSDVYLDQFHTFGSLQRYRPEVMEAILLASDMRPEDFPWLLDRFISVGYYALINYEKVAPRPDALSDSINWYTLEELPPLLFDHEKMVTRALETLRSQLDTKLLGMNLLPDRFTMKELQSVYEAILGEKLHRSSFQRRLLGLNILERHEKRHLGQAHKSPYLYSYRVRG